MASSVVIGVDVGGTNTDCAAVSCDGTVVAQCKTPTTPDVTSGVVSAVKEVVKASSDAMSPKYIVIGTTHFVNAIVEAKADLLAKVVILRCCGYSSRGIPPCADFPPELKEIVYDSHAFLDGGFQLNGTPITPFEEDKIRDQIKQALGSPDMIGEAKQVVVSGVFSAVQNDHEERVAELIKEMYPAVQVTKSYTMSGIGLLERENAAVLNAALQPLARKTIAAFKASIKEIGLDCPLYLTQNDGTLISADGVAELPIRTFASGPTNSMRGAAFLTHETEAIVVDIGGTTTDVGVLDKGYPRQAVGSTKIADVRTNFSMPDVVSCGLGGGSIVKTSSNDDDGKVTIGPQSVGYQITTKALSFGGDAMTTTDFAIAKNGTDILSSSSTIASAKKVPAGDLGGEETVARVNQQIVDMVEEVIDQVKTSKEDLPVILVGGGSILLNGCTADEIKGASKLIVPENFGVVNAVGAAISQVSGVVERPIALEGKDRAAVVDELKSEAIGLAVKAGAIKDSVTIVSVSETPIQYLPGELTRFVITAVGDLEAFSPKRGTAPSPVQSSADKRDTPVAASTPITPKGEVELMKDPTAISATVNIDAETGLWTLSDDDIQALAIGTGILGTGGGGDPHYSCVVARKLLSEGKKITILSPDHLGDEEMCYPIGFMGAPTIFQEKLMSGLETKTAIGALHNFSKGKEMAAVISIEAGGLNGIEPLITAAQLGIPVLDVDLMGRAFPKIDMVLTAINGLGIIPCALADDQGNVKVLEKSESAAATEDLMRAFVVEFGCVGALALPPLSGSQIKGNTVRFSLTRAWQIGSAVLKAQRLKVSPVNAILEQVHGRLIFRGKIVDVHRFVDGGFSKGVVTLEGLKGDSQFEKKTLKIHLQNENLIAHDGETGEVIAAVPTLISMIDSLTGLNCFTETLAYGMRVSVITMACDPAMATENALKVVGPKAFGYDQVTHRK